MTNQSRLDSILGDLQDYRRWLESELERTVGALAAIEATSKPVQRAGHTARKDQAADASHSVGAGSASSTSTSDMVLAVFRASPDREMTASAAVEELQRRGWATDSRDPVNAMRAALARLAQAGELERLKAGVYRLRVEGSDLLSESSEPEDGVFPSLDDAEEDAP